MKKVSIFIMLLLTVTAFGQLKPQKVYSIVKEVQEESWYKEQAKLWKAKVDEDNQNAEAWYYYYMSIHAQSIICESENTEKNQIIKDCYKAVPNSFEANFLMYKGYKGEGKGDSNFNYLEKAYEINPYDSRSYVDFLTHYAIIHDDVNYKKFCHKYFKANEIPAAIYNWAYNLLSELDKNAIVFTAGDNDTYSLWMLQVAKSFRPDVYVVNTALLTLDDYRDKLFKKMGIKPLNIKVFGSKSMDELHENQIKVYNHIFNNDQNLPVYVASTAIFQFQDDYSDNLYLTGLAYKYSKQSIDNISLIRRNYEKRYLLDYLTQVFSFNIANTKSDQINATYLPAFVKLYKHYQETEEVEKMRVLKKYIIEISQKSGQETEISELLGAKNSIPNDFSKVLLNTKQIEKEYVKLNNNVYINKFEVTNVQYQKFLDNVLNSRNISLFKNVIYDSTMWSKKYGTGNLEPMTNLYHWHPAYQEFPIVNITKYAAEQYCVWLTKQYNKQSKRKFSNVVFRLPTEKEWEFAARNGKSSSKTGFENDKIIDNKKGCYLVNLKYENEDGTGSDYYRDGGFTMVKVDSYLENEFGIFNMIGNVSEMIAEPKVSKGGSWNSFLEDSYIDLRTDFNEPNPETGFRIVMEVIEE